jgi:hypothetical protein
MGVAERRSSNLAAERMPFLRVDDGDHPAGFLGYPSVVDGRLGETPQDAFDVPAT